MTLQSKIDKIITILQEANEDLRKASFIWPAKPAITLGKDNIIRCQKCGAPTKSHLLPTGQCVLQRCECEPEAVWKISGWKSHELTATEINLRHEIRELKQKLDSAESAFVLGTSNMAALSTEAYGLRNKLKACEQQRDAAYEERNHLVEKLVAADKRIDGLNAALANQFTGEPKHHFSHPGASIRPEVCSHCSMLMEPKFYQDKNFTGWVWFCPTCQK